MVGELQPKTYEAKDGRLRVSLDISADEIEFLDGGASAEKHSEPAAQQGSIVDPNTFADISSDDIPF